MSDMVALEQTPFAAPEEKSQKGYDGDGYITGGLFKCVSKLWCFQTVEWGFSETGPGAKRKSETINRR